MSQKNKGGMAASLDLTKPILRDAVMRHAPPGYEPAFMVIKLPPSVIKKRAASLYGDDAILHEGHWQLQFRKCSGGFVAVRYEVGTTVYVKLRKRKLPDGDTPHPSKHLACSNCAATPAIVQTLKCGACQWGDLALTDPEKW